MLLLASGEISLEPPAARYHGATPHTGQQTLGLQLVKVFAHGHFGDLEDPTQVAHRGAPMGAQVGEYLLTPPICCGSLIYLGHVASGELRIPSSGFCPGPGC